MDRFFAPTVESIGPRPSVQAPGDGLRGHYKAILNSVPSNGSCLVVVPGLDSLHHMEANCPTNATGSVGDEVFVGFDDEKSLWIASPVSYPPVPVPTWQPLAYNATNWQDWGAPFQTGQYAKDALGFVHVRGLIKSVAGYSFATPSTLTVATLPAGFRPAKQEMFDVFQEDTIPNFVVLRCDVLTNGQILLNGGGGSAQEVGTGNNGNAAYLSLKHMTFAQGN